MGHTFDIHGYFQLNFWPCTSAINCIHLKKQIFVLMSIVVAPYWPIPDISEETMNAKTHLSFTLA